MAQKYMAYQPDFIPGHVVPLPDLHPVIRKERAPLLTGTGHEIHYEHYSTVVHKKRKFAFFSASNLDGQTWKKIQRSGTFRKDDKNISPDYQWGNELYDAIKASHGRPNDFEEGHLASFQEVLWGKGSEINRAAKDTFFFTNCVPQHERLNSGTWRSLEQYILKTEAAPNNLKISIFTGPVLSEKDPYFIEPINGQQIQIPLAFWKVIYYKNQKGLSAVGFMMSHKKLLLEDGTVTYKKMMARPHSLMALKDEEYFMDFPKSATYQVSVEFIRQVTKLDFHLKGVALPYQKDANREVIYKRIEVDRIKNLALRFHQQPLDFELKGITL